MAHEYDRAAGDRTLLQEQFDERDPGGRVHRRGRLVRHHERRSTDQGPRHGNALLLADAELP